jgi:aspartyl-tRNA(Asn)/glutamyl-tRNA(Gln) amidotransferase subunit B
MDSGKSNHERDASLIDFNRAGSALIELVTEPDMQSAEEAGAFVRKLQHLLRHLGICNGNMELGELRCDVNVSVHPNGGAGVRCEIKNINSVRHIVKAIGKMKEAH